MGIGDWINVVRIQTPAGPPVPDGDGGYTQQYADAAPATWHASLTPATRGDLERLAASTVISQASYLLRGRYRADVTTQSRIVFEGRTLNVAGGAKVLDRGVWVLELVAVEVVA